MNVHEIVKVLDAYNFNKSHSNLLCIEAKNEGKSLCVLPKKDLSLKDRIKFELYAINPKNCHLSTIATFIIEKILPDQETLFREKPHTAGTILKVIDLLNKGESLRKNSALLEQLEKIKHQLLTFTFPICTLPEELQSHVLSFCSVKELGRIECLSKEFKKMVDKFQLWNSFALSSMLENEKSELGFSVTNKGIVVFPHNFDAKKYVKTGGWKLSERENKLLDTLYRHPIYRSSCEIPIDFRAAIDAMSKATPERFRMCEQHGQGHHMQRRTNAVDFLRDCVTNDGQFRDHIDAYKKRQSAGKELWVGHLVIPELEKIQKNPLAPKTFEELSSGLEALLKRVEQKLPQKQPVNGRAL